MKSIQNRSVASPLQMSPLWFARLEALANAAEIAAPTDAAALLRRLCDLIGTAAPEGASDPHPSVEALLAIDGGETSAALAMLPRGAAWMLSSGAGDDLFLATILLPSMVEEITAQGASAALALVVAMALAAAGGGMMIEDDTGPDPRFA